MLSNEEISERNGYLISLIAELNIGIHVVNLPHKPKFLNSDSTKQLNAYVNNFHLILTNTQGEEFFKIKLKPIEKMNMDEIRHKFIEWIVMFEHSDIFTVSINGTGLFVTGFNHHNKINKTNPYPVFARFSPIIYDSANKAESIIERFSEYNLKINQ
jgi:hypothetical protein